MKLLWAICIFAATVAAVRAEERPPEVARAVADAGLRGSATVDFLAFPLYEVQLWTPERKNVDRAESFALTLTYKRGFKARSLAKASVSEVARIEGRPKSDFNDLEQIVLGCFVDVTADDRITGVSASADTAKFFVNGAQSCSVTYPRLRDRFFGIWLGRDTRDPVVTARLRGEP
jgi:hypothetical protein